MPCNCDGFDPPFENHPTALEKKWEKEKRTKEALCKLLTTIFFESDDIELLKKIKEDSSRLRQWFMDHMREDIKICEKKIQQYNISFNFEERQRWETKRSQKIAYIEKIKEIIISEWKEE